MKTAKIALMAVFAFTAPVSVSAATPANTATEAKVPSAVAMQLVSLLASEESVRVQTEGVLREQMPKVLASDPNMAKLEQRWPGFIDECVAAMRPIVIASALKELPERQRQMAALFDRELSPGDIDTIREFFASPAGQKVLDGLRRGADFSGVLKKQMVARDTKVTAGDLTGISQSAAAPVLAQLDAAEIEQVEAFGATPAGTRFQALNPKMAELSANLNNAADPAVENQTADAVLAIVRRHQAADTGTNK